VKWKTGVGELRFFYFWCQFKHMKLILIVGLGSFIGGVLRYLISMFVKSKFVAAFPVGTFTVNIIGCFLIGIVFGLAMKGAMDDEMRLFLATGILGGFTTFSAFSQETFYLMRHQQTGLAVIYVLASVVVGLMATAAGNFIVQK